MRHPTQGNEPNQYLHNDEWGQNLACNYPNPSSPAFCLDGWVTQECPKYNPSNPLDVSKGKVGHYTQVVWKDTTDVVVLKLVEVTVILSGLVNTNQLVM